jgi:hypothetical protein
MSFETDLIALLTPLFPTKRVWFDTTPDGIDLSAGMFCIIQQVGGDDRWYVDNTPHDFANARLQFTVWGPTTRSAISDKMRELRTEIMAANSATLITLPQGAPVSDYNDVLKLRGAHQSYGFWYPDPTAV